ncbi:hypothetical protein IV203_038804 [Nitzschia inconspicua]|uniref:Uncharacterized protein n=1 Tax=Nitzschia inconspicua TaxID=303405 RepID=A0A9K3KM51_9STRA|nr:hypothetical protein IV203_004928 [Nitzschia inconspicua]KAG7362331.1 hypothetical protein IV203_025215 [Nitzschia inconspicua]KAG7365600.1 hypothetical protein IV203_038804 [Nitzschia inconspicua]
MPSVPINAAGDLPLNDDLACVLTIKKGSIRDNPRGGTSKTLSFRVSEGLAVLKAKIQATPLQPPLLEDFEVFFRRTKTSVQASYVPLSSDNFTDQLKHRWSKITQREVDEWQQDAGKTPQESNVFEFFVYQPRNRRGNTQQLQRATASRMASARNQILAHHQRNNTQVGPIQLEHLATLNARLPDGSDLAFPNDVSNRQAEALDRSLEQFNAEEADAVARRNATYKPTLIRFMGSTPIPVEVNVQSLREALGNPPYDCYHNGIFHGYRHDAVLPEEDVNDDEHETTQPGQGVNEP